jgi:hypothetical protein
MENLDREQRTQLKKFMRMYFKMENGYYETYYKLEDFNSLYAFINEKKKRKKLISIDEQTLEVFFNNLAD